MLDSVNAVSEQVDPGSSLVSARPDHWSSGGCSAALVLRDRDEEAEVLTRLARGIMERDPETSVGIITRVWWRREDIDRAFARESSYAVRRWDLAIDDPAILALIRSVIATLPRGATVADARLAVFDAVDAADVDAHELIEDAFDILDQSDATTARAAMGSIRVSDPKQTIGPGVHLLNAHTGKGQQFDWVFVVGLEDGHVPLKRSSHGEALTEEHRVLLVMLSRARHGLVLTTVHMTSGMYGPYAAKPSRWWEGLRAEHDSWEGVDSHIRTTETITRQG